MKRLSAALALLALLCAGLLACALAYLQSQGVTPRALAPYLLHRTSGHNELIEAAGRVTAGSLLRLDRGSVQRQAMPPLVVGARPEAPPAPSGNERVVASVEAARQAFGNAAPGDVITFLPVAIP